MTITYVSSGVTSGVTEYFGNTISVFSSGSTLDIVLSGGTEIVSDGGISDSTSIKNLEQKLSCKVAFRMMPP